MSKVQVIQASKGASTERVPVAAYCRVSSKSEDQGHSFAAQVREYTAQIESNPKWMLAGIYADEGISGISARKRPEFQRLIEDCRQGKVKRILTKSISRFARNTQECLEYVRELKLLGVSVCFEKEGLDTRDMAGELLVSVFGSLAQEESISISKNVRMSNQRRMERGEFISGLTPYGYRRTGAQLQIYEPEADIVRWIFRQYLNGVPEKDIVKAVKIMDAEINAGSTSRAWTRHTIAYIIKNERYVGDMLLQKNYTALSDPPRRMINYGEVARYYVENSHPAIISRADFNKAQALRKKRSGTQTVQHETPLQRRLVCEECGSVFKKRINKKGIIRWSCYKHNTDRRACPTMPVADALIWDAFTWMIKILISEQMELLRTMVNQLCLLLERTATGDGDINILNQEIVRLNDQIHAIHRLYSMKLFDIGTFQERTNALQARLQELQGKRKILIAGLAQDDALEKTKQIISTLQEIDIESEKDIQRGFLQIVDKVLVNQEKKVTFHLINGLKLVGWEHEKGWHGANGTE